MPIPKYDELFNPLIKALHLLGGSGSVSEIEEKVVDILDLTEEEAGEIHTGNRTVLSYRLAWSRYYLKRSGILENSSRGVWALTNKGKNTKRANKEEVKKRVRDISNKISDIEELVEEGDDPSEDILIWKDELLDKLKKIEPEAFERLCQRILRESGFFQVKVIGKSGDGGIDGKGIVRLNGFLSFHILFQCKRYSGSVSSQQIRDFRGAMMGRTDKGLFITTGNFTRDAKKEAIREGAPPIDLIDGELLVEKMKELGLGVKVTTEEVIEIDSEWIENF